MANTAAFKLHGQRAYPASVHRLLVILLAFTLCACGQSAPPAPASPSASARPTLTATATGTTAFTPTGAATVSPTSTAARRPTLTPTLTLTAFVEPFTRTPTVTGLAGRFRRTPATLMLHEQNMNFDPVPFLKAFLALLKEHALEGITYQAITADPDIVVEKQGRLVILTIDDISLQAEIDPSVQAMIELLLEAGYPAVLGVITEGKLANPQTVKRLQALAAQGWEIAAHTDTHRNLWELEKKHPGEEIVEVNTCLEKIAANVGVRPITLILPYGQMVENGRFLRKAHILWAVGINGGERYSITDNVSYLGREGPAATPEMTYEAMMKRFNP